MNMLLTPETGITPVTTFISPNEKIWALAEINLTPFQASAGGKKFTPESWQGRHRYRIAWVNRGDVIHEYQELSPNPISAPEVRIPCCWEHSYAEACGMATDYATGKHAQRDRDFCLEKQAESTLIVDFLNQLEAKAYTARNRSTFGPLVQKQRDGFPSILQKDG
jgi:hypothetical protein